MHALRYAFRSLARTPGYTAIALATLALGIGVNTSMFSVVDALLFRSAPYPEPERIVMLEAATRTGQTRVFSEHEIREIQPHTNGFQTLTTMGYSVWALAEPGRPAERVRGMTFSSDMMETFRIAPALGRPFAAEEFENGKNQVVLLTDTFWLTRFGGDPSVIGRTLRLDGESVTIIGVMPPRFDYKMLWGNIALIRPLNFTKDQLLYRGYRTFSLVGRLKPGVTAETAALPLASVAAEQEKTFPQEYPGLRYRAVPMHETVMDNVGRNIAWMLLGLSGFVLLICCANLANLQLARATASAREFAIRAALGATRSRLIAQQLTECVMLSVVGAVLGVIIALWINSALERSISIDGTRGLALTLDTSVLLGTLVIALLTGILFGVVPALFAARNDVNSTLKAQARGSTTGRGHHLTRHALIIGEVALALVLLGGAAIMNRGFDRLLKRNPGWETNELLMGFMPLPEDRFDNGDKRVAFYRRLEDKLATLPGVESVALTNGLPLFSYASASPVFRDDAGATSGDNPVASGALITPNYFATLGIPILQGRTFPADVKPDSPQQVLINEALARRFWPGESPIGKRLGVIENNVTVWREVIGVVGHVEMVANITDPASNLQFYRPLVQEPWAFVNLALRSSHPATLADSVRRAVSELDADIAVDQIGTVQQYIQRTQHNMMVIGKLLAGFAILGLVLAAIGIYGVISNLVAQRTSEFGIRLALGATPRDILHDVISRGLRLAAIGLAIGFVGAWGLGRFFASFMPRLAASDPLGIAGTAVLLFFVALFASWVPARRATKVDPMIALRAE